MGAIKFPIPINNGKVYDEIEIKEIITGVIADANREMEKGDPYKAIQMMISGCTEKIGDKTDKASIKEVIGHMPYKTAEYIAIKILLLGEVDDGIEGVYYCPRCDMQIICEKTEDSDTLDYLEDQEIKCIDENTPIEHELSSPVELPAENEENNYIESLTIKYPTLNNCSNAIKKYGDRDKVRLQLAILNDALVKINGKEIDYKWKNRYGMYLFERLKNNDIRKINEKISGYGIDSEVEKTCRGCGKKFKTPINTANFFASALRSNEL